MNFRKFCRQFLSVIRFGLLGLLTLLLVIGLIPSAVAQLPSLSEESQSKPNSVPEQVRRYGEIEVIWVESPIDNKTLIEIASPTVYNRNEPKEGQIPVELRAQEIKDRLWRYVSRFNQSKEFSKVSIAVLNNHSILQVQDHVTSRPLKLVTVTETDSDYHGKTVEELAQEWQKTLQNEIKRIDKLLSVEVLKQSLAQAFGILLGIFIATGVIWLLYRLLRNREKSLQDKYQAKAETTQPVIFKSSPINRIDAEEAQAEKIAEMHSRFTSIVHHQLSLKRQVEVYHFLKWLLFWILILTWYIGIFAIVSRIPVLMRYKGWIVATPLQLVWIWFFTSLAIRLNKSIIHRLTNAWGNTSLSFGEAQRKTLRSTTVSGALEGLATFILTLVGIVWTLNVFKVPTSSIIAGGAIFGLAISFGSQSLIKDLVNGCLILLEDQFAVGDVVTIGTEGGLVENLNLRITQLRNSEGQLITIPNSSIIQVKNLTRLWSRVDFSIEVAYENDPKEVLNVLSQVAQQMYDEPQWHEHIIEPPEVLGIDSLSHNGMLVRVWIKTFPMQQWSVGREYRYRLRLAFKEHNIQIGRPQWISYNTSLN